MASTLGAANPLRYKGYIYDSETGLYYLQSRYYNPEWGRFINADTNIDDIGNLLTNNPYMYCKNTPVNFSDPKGKNPGDLFDSTDAAAEDCINYIGQKSIDDNKEYYTVIYKVTKNGNTLFTYDEPNAGSEYSSAGVIPMMIKHNIIGNLAATVHTHGQWHGGTGNEGPSDADVDLLGSVCPAYVANPSGHVYKIDPKGSLIQRNFKILSGAYEALFLGGGDVKVRKPWMTGFAYQPDAFWYGKDPTTFPIRRKGFEWREE